MSFHRHHPDQGAGLNQRARSAKAPSLRSGGSASPVGSVGRGGSGARFSGGTSVLRLAGLLALTITALLVTAAPAFAAQSHIFKPALSFGSAGSGNGQFEFSEQSSVAVNDETGDLYVTDTTNGRVQEFEADGTFIRAFGSFAEPTFVAVDNSPAGEGNVYVVDSATATVSKFNSEGTPITSWGTAGTIDGSTATDGPFGTITGIAVGAGGNLFVYQKAEEGFLFKFAASGKFTTDFPTAFGTTAAGIAVDSTGAIYKVRGNGEVVKLGPSGKQVLIESVDPGPATGLAIDPSSDELYVDDGGHIARYSSTGASLEPEIGIAEGLSGAVGLAVDSSDKTLYTVNPPAAQVDVFPLLTIPDAVATPPSAIGETTAILNGEVNPDGIEVTKCEFEYVTEAAFSATGFTDLSSGGATPCASPGAAEIGSGTAPVQVHAEITGLSAKTRYRFRLAATNANGQNHSPSLAFATTAEPEITSTSVTSVTATSANLEAELDPHGLSTTYHFEYDTTPYPEGGPAHGTSTPTASAGSGTTDVTRAAQIQGLQPLTTYHFRLVATNSLGTVDGPDRSFTTQGPGSATLPDGRAWELVTPPNKHGAPLEPITEEGGVIQAAVDGSAFATVAIGPLGPESQGVRSPEASQLLSRRGAGGWSTEDITTPHEEVSLVLLGQLSEYQLFSENLSAGVVEPKGATLLDPSNPTNTERTPYRREADGAFVPLVNSANVPTGTKFGGNERHPGEHAWENGVAFQIATPDLNHTLLSSPQALTGGFGPNFEPDPSGIRQNLYELSAGTLRLVGVFPDGEPTAEAGFQVSVGNNSQNMRGAISDNGERVFFGPEIFMRNNATAPPSASGACDELGKACTIRIDAAEAGCATCESGGGVFQAASADGSKVFFTDRQRLTADSTAGNNEPDLYMCEVPLAAPEPTCALTDLTVDHNPGESANVQGMVSAIDAGGVHVYFVATGVLTGETNEHGEAAVPGAPNLYEYDTVAHQIHLVAVLSPGDDVAGSIQADLSNLAARASPHGRYFTFMSQRSLTGYDNRDAKSGERDAEVYLFDSATDALRCVSCNPTGARPLGVFDPNGAAPYLLVDHHRTWREHWLAASIPGWTTLSLDKTIYQSRFLSDSGRTFFNSSDALVPSDTNGVMDVYEYEPPGVGDCTASSSTFSSASGGCVSLISSGTSPEESAFLDASESGNDIFFLTQSRLTAKDIDGAFDVYDASVGGGEPSVVNSPACEGDACQPPATPPNHPTPGTALLNGPGNLLQCPKGKVKQKGHCVKRNKAKHHKKHKGHKRHARSNRRAGK